MGIARGAIALLLDEARQRPFTGRLATLGRQTIGATAKDIAGEFRRFGAGPRLLSRAMTSRYSSK